ncbi:hypothetical protein Tco_0516381 [Tanacetum coccineum]
MSGEEPATQIAPVESPQMVSTVKLPILKKGEYTLWSMRMEQYLTNTDYSLWQVILNGDGPIQVTTDENGVETEVPPKTAQALLARQRERKAKSILLLAIPDEYQLRFHAIKDAKTLWAAIKSRFGGNVESKKMQKNVLKQQFENFSVSDTEGLDKAYDRFQKLISLLEVHGAAVSNEDANQKFLRALPSSWNNVALIMRNKAGIDDLDIDDLYNNLKVFEADIKGSSRSSSNSQNVAFLSVEDTNNNNEVSTANGVPTAAGHNSQGQASSSLYTDELIGLIDSNQSAFIEWRQICDNIMLAQELMCGYLSKNKVPRCYGGLDHDDNDLQDERQDRPKEEEVESRRSKRARTEKSFGPNFVSFMVENKPRSYREAIIIALICLVSEAYAFDFRVNVVMTELLRLLTLLTLPPRAFEIGVGLPVATCSSPQMFLMSTVVRLVNRAGEVKVFPLTDQDILERAKLEADEEVLGRYHVMIVLSAMREEHICAFKTMNLILTCKRCKKVGKS